MSSCNYVLNIAPFQNGVNATLLPDIGMSQIPSNSTTTGTFNNMSFQNGGIAFSGTIGDTCTAGYYVTYNMNVLNLKNILDITLAFPSSTLCLDGNIPNLPYNTTKTYSYTYFTLINRKIKQC